MSKSALIRLIIVGLLYCVGTETSAQVVFQPKPVEYNFKGVLYKTEKVFDLRAHTSGLVFSYKTGKLQSYYNTKYYNFEFGYIKDSRENRQNKNLSFPSNGLSKSFTYGKRNSFFNLRVSAGGKRYLSEKTRRKGLAVGFIYEGGATIGLLKPTYLKVVTFNEVTQESELVEIKYSDETAEDFLARDVIFGGTSFFKGINETDITVGAHGKVAAHFSIGAFDQKVSAVEIGLMADIFPAKVPIMAETTTIKNNFFFLNLYLSLQFGSRK